MKRSRRNGILAAVLVATVVAVAAYVVRKNFSHEPPPTEMGAIDRWHEGGLDCLTDDDISCVARNIGDFWHGMKDYQINRFFDIEYAVSRYILNPRETAFLLDQITLLEQADSAGRLDSASRTLYRAALDSIDCRLRKYARYEAMQRSILPDSVLHHPDTPDLADTLFLDLPPFAKQSINQQHKHL